MILKNLLGMSDTELREYSLHLAAYNGEEEQACKRKQQAAVAVVGNKRVLRKIEDAVHCYNQ